MRICSLLPSATDIVFALGLGDQLVAITHECDVPAGAPSVPVITKSTVAKARRNSREIHNHVMATMHRGSSLYALDQDLLERLDPELILTQELCEVCAISYQEVTAVVHRLEVRLPDQRRVLSLEPHRLGDILTIIEHVGQAAGVPERAQQLVCELQQQLAQITAVTRRVAVRPRVYAMEWLDPPYTAGHWIPEMIRLAGGDDALATEGGPSVELSWVQIAHYDPEVLILMPCSFSLERTLAELQELGRPPGWSRLRAVQSGHIYAFNGAAYFSRSADVRGAQHSGRNPPPRPVSANHTRRRVAASRMIVDRRAAQTRSIRDKMPRQRWRWIHRCSFHHVRSDSAQPAVRPWKTQVPNA